MPDRVVVRAGMGPLRVEADVQGIVVPRGLGPSDQTVDRLRDCAAPVASGCAQRDAPADHAAFTSVALLLLNLDEALSK